MAIDPYRRYSNESEIPNLDSYDDFKSKKPHFGLQGFHKKIQRFKGLTLTKRFYLAH